VTAPPLNSKTVSGCWGKECCCRFRIVGTHCLEVSRIDGLLGPSMVERMALWVGVLLGKCAF
jgi:hypothetical protein